MRLDRGAAWLACGTFAMLFGGGTANEIMQGRITRPDTILALSICLILAVASAVAALKPPR